MWMVHEVWVGQLAACIHVFSEWAPPWHQGTSRGGTDPQGSSLPGQAGGIPPGGKQRLLIRVAETGGEQRTPPRLGRAVSEGLSGSSRC